MSMTPDTKIGELIGVLNANTGPHSGHGSDVYDVDSERVLSTAWSL